MTRFSKPNELLLNFHQEEYFNGSYHLGITVSKFLYVINQNKSITWDMFMTILVFISRDTHIKINIL